MVKPVPPLMAATAVPVQVPEVIVPTVAISVPTNFAAVMDPANMALVTFKAPMAVAKEPVPEPVTSPVRVIVWSPVLVPERLAAEILLVTTTLPVLASPKVKDCLAVVLMVGVVLKIKVPEVEALPVRPKTWNLALEVAVPPMAKSSVMLRGVRVPEFLCQLLPEEVIQDGRPAETDRTWLVEPMASLDRVLAAEE